MKRTLQTIQTLKTIRKYYLKLPYITVKKHSKYYLIPHRPVRPFSFRIDDLNKYASQKSLKYNQYYRNSEIQDVKQMLINQIQDKDLSEQQKNRQIQQLNNRKTLVTNYNFDQQIKKFNQKFQQYEYKYVEPLKIMYKTSFSIYRHLYIKNNQQKINQQKQRQIQLAKLSSNKNTKKILRGISSINQLKIPQKWMALSQTEKQVYRQMELNIKTQNQQRINQFIQNHQIPVIKKSRTHTIFSSRYASEHGIGALDNRVRQQYRKLSSQQKKKLRQQALMINAQQRNKYNNFLAKWNITKQQLNNIIQVSKKYSSLLRKSMKQKRAETLSQLDQYDIQVSADHQIQQEDDSFKNVN